MFVVAVPTFVTKISLPISAQCWFASVKAIFRALEHRVAPLDGFETEKRG
jgi:hypothetical protein